MPFRAGSAWHCYDSTWLSGSGRATSTAGTTRNWRDTNNSSPDEFTPLYTAAGQLSDDDQHYKYTYDAWGRLVKITNQSNATVTEYEYNGLGHRIGHRWDVDADTDLDWEWLAYDDKWRVIARFADSSVVTEPKEQIYHHAAGLNGQGGSSYIDLVIARDQFDYSEDVPVAVRDYVIQNWRADVVALAAPDGDLRERVTYDAYGVPFATHPTDLTTGTTGGIAGYGCPNGVVDSSDYSYFLTLYGASDWRADWNRDGTLSAADNTAFVADHGAATGSWGRGVLSNRSNILGYAGYMHEPATGSAGSGQGTMWHIRHRVLHAGYGRWLTQDPTTSFLTSNRLAYCDNGPFYRVDSVGLAWSNVNFVWHYFSGGGSDVWLEDIGLAAAYEGHHAVLAATAWYQEKTLLFAWALARSLDLNCGSTQCEERYKLEYIQDEQELVSVSALSMFTMNYITTKRLAISEEWFWNIDWTYSIGGHQIYASFSCEASAHCSPGTPEIVRTVRCHFGYYIDDPFTDPLDLLDGYQKLPWYLKSKLGLLRLPVYLIANTYSHTMGSPYRIRHQWQREIIQHEWELASPWCWAPC